MDVRDFHDAGLYGNNIKSIRDVKQIVDKLADRYPRMNREDFILVLELLKNNSRRWK